MKPTGPIPSGYTSVGNALLIGGKSAQDLMDQHPGHPLYVYDFGLVEQKIAQFRAQFGPVKLHYAIKANSYAPLLCAIAPLVDGFDVASAQEIRRAVAAGMHASAISFAGPGKRDADIAAALELGVTLNCESEHQIARALAIASEMEVRAKLAVRVNPDFEIKGSGMRMGGGAKPFGIDAERASAACKMICDAGAEWAGLHIFTGSQSLDASALIDAQKATLALACSIAKDVGQAPPLLNMGGGFGIPYFHKDTPLDTEAVSAALLPALEVLAQDADQLGWSNTQFALELGRWLVGEAGVYLTRVIDTKISRGHHFAVTDGGMHHHLAASGNFGQVVRRNYPVAIANKMAESADSEVTIVGCLCTPLDKLAEAALLPKVAIGDIVAVFASGAYGLSASPQGFLSQEQALELLIRS